MSTESDSVITEWIWKTEDDSRYAARIGTTDSLEELKKWAVDNNCCCRFFVCLVPCGFWIPQDEWENITSKGDIGYMGPPVPEPKEMFPDKSLALRIIMTANYIDSQKLIEETMTTTKGPRHSLTPWHSDPVRYYTTVEVEMGVYGKPGFEEAYQAIIKLKPKLTRIEFLIGFREDRECEWGGFDGDLSETRLYDGDVGLINKFNETKTETIFRDEFTVFLTLLAIDLPANMETVKRVLQTYCRA